MRVDNPWYETSLFIFYFQPGYGQLSSYDKDDNDFFLKNLSQQTTILVFDYKDSHEKKMKDEIFFPHGFIIFQTVSDSKFGQSK